MDDIVPRREAQLAWVDDQEDRIALVRLGQHSAPPIVLTGTGAAIFRLVDGRRSAEEIVDLVAAEYAAAAEDIRDQVAQFLTDLHRQGILT